MMKIGRMGDTSSTSIVPVSFSRTMEMAVIMAQMSISISPITPGTKLYALFIWGLNSKWVCTPTVPGCPSRRACPTMPCT